MFYSHEILTSRKYGVATVWLVATLGAKSSNTKKLSRKAILEVNVKKACATIMEPDAPMALRLQSNLLYGVSRVYDQQCHYVLQDAQAAQAAIRSLISLSRDNQLDVTAGKARPEQLVLLDDPAFLPDFALPALDFDLDSLEINDVRESQSMMSVSGRGRAVSSSRAASVLGINLPSSSGNSEYQLPNNDPFEFTPGSKGYQGLGREEEEEWIHHEDVFGFDEHGNLQDGTQAERDQMTAGVSPISHRPRESAASGRVRKEHEDGRAPPVIAGEDDMINLFGDDDMALLPDDVEPFSNLPLMAGGLGGNDQPQHHTVRDLVYSDEELSSDSAQAPLVKQKRPKAKSHVFVDSLLELKNIEMKMWQMQYPARMLAATLLKDNVKARTQAKKNAMHFVFGGGLGGVGMGIGSDKLPSPLDMFAGDSLLALITGRHLTGMTLPKGKKRKADKDISPESKRHESETGRATPSHATPVVEEDEGIRLMGDDDLSQSIELGRDAPSGLADHLSSTLLPWNKSASVQSHNRNLSSQHGRGTQFGSSIGGHNRLTSASPLVGRGSALPSDIDQFMHDVEEAMYGRDDEFDGFGAAVGPSSIRGFGSAFRSHTSQSHQDEFELFGQAANVDTQTAGSSQWVRDALDKESNNFFEYVRNTIEEKEVDELANALDVDEIPRQDGCVTFEELFNVEGNSHIVAAQAFYHVLCLATKRRLRVEQDVREDEVTGGPVPFGEIRISCITSY